MLYRFVDAQRAEGFPVRMVCAVVGVSPSAYYGYGKRLSGWPVNSVRADLGLTGRWRFERRDRRRGTIRLSGRLCPLMLIGEGALPWLHWREI